MSVRYSNLAGRQPRGDPGHHRPTSIVVSLPIVCRHVDGRDLNMVMVMVAMMMMMVMMMIIMLVVRMAMMMVITALMMMMMIA